MKIASHRKLAEQSAASTRRALAVLAPAAHDDIRACGTVGGPAEAPSAPQLPRAAGAVAARGARVDAALSPDGAAEGSTLRGRM
jgi:hypothetical protein